MTMRRRRPIVYALIPLVDIPSGNVHVVPIQRQPDDLHAVGADPEAVPGEQAPPQWVIHDGDGHPLEPAWDSRGAALRRMGLLAFRGASLPLTLHGPDGRPTGDRLP